LATFEVSSCYLKQEKDSPYRFMKTNHIILTFVSVVVLAAIAYTLTSAEDPETYIENIEAERERQFKFIRYNIESPLTEEQKRNFKELTFYPIDPAYKVKARIIPKEDKKVREVPLTDGSKEHTSNMHTLSLSWEGRPIDSSCFRRWMKWTSGISFWHLPMRRVVARLMAEDAISMPDRTEKTALRSILTWLIIPIAPIIPTMPVPSRQEKIFWISLLRLERKITRNSFGLPEKL